MSPLSILDARAPQPFRIGDALARSWGVLSRHLLTFLSLIAIMQLPQLFMSLSRQPGSQGAIAGRFFLASLLRLVLLALAEAIVVFATFQDLRGREVSAGESISRGLRRIVPVVVLSLLVGLLIGFGLVFLVIPGLIAMTRFAVSLPACVVEEWTPVRSMSRSADLTEGYRWPIFGVLAALEILSLLVILTIGQAMPRGIIATVSIWVWGVVFGSYSAVFRTILYHDLRAAKEGIDIDQIAAVFD